MGDPYPWLHHEPPWIGPRWVRLIRAAWRRIAHPYGQTLAQLETVGPDPDMVEVHPWDGRIIRICCPACRTWRTDPTADCPGCGL